MRHFQPRVHHISMSHSLPCIVCILSVGRSHTRVLQQPTVIDQSMLHCSPGILVSSHQANNTISFGRMPYGVWEVTWSSARVVVFITTASVYNLGHGLPHYRLNSIISYMVGTPYLPSGLLPCLRRLIYPRSVQGTVKCTAASGLCNSSQFLQCW